jgi:hypothetical protein
MTVLQKMRVSIVITFMIIKLVTGALALTVMNVRVRIQVNDQVFFVESPKENLGKLMVS